MTTKQAFEQVLEALRANRCQPELHRDQGRCISGNVACQARAALDAWEGRQAMSDDPLLRRAVRLELPHSEEIADVRNILDSVEEAMFGSPLQVGAGKEST